MMRALSALALAFAVLALPVAAQDESLSFQELRDLIKLGTDEKELIAMVNAADVLTVTEADLPKLKEAGASEAVIKAIAARLGSNVVDRVLAMVAAGKKEDEIIAWVLSTGTRTALTGTEKLKLTRGGASLDMVRALEGKYAFPGYRAYKDPLGMLAIQLPNDWRSYHWFTGDGVKVLLSPEPDVKGANQFKTGFQIQTSFEGRWARSRREGYDIFDDHVRGLNALLQLNRKYDLKTVEGDAGQPRRATVCGSPSVEQDFYATMVGAPCRETMIKVNVEEVHYFIEYVAPKHLYASLEPVFRKMLASLQAFPDRTNVMRRRAALRGDETLDMLREAVVMVMCEFDQGAGSGSGFFVRDDGWVLTNHHVVCSAGDHAACTNPANWKLAKRITLVWDAKVPSGREDEAHRKVEATLDDTYYSITPGVDIALLRVPSARTPYRTIAISTVASGLVREGDPVAALGFPQPSRMGFGNLFFTQGAISRINYLEKRFGKPGRRREVNDLYTDAVINGGNSGGPCVNLATGAVIGLNTYLPLSVEGKELEYAGVVLVDHILYHFPQIRWYARGAKPRPQEHLELGAMLLGKGNVRSAGVEFRRAARGVDELDPEQRSRLHHQLHLYLDETGDRAGAAQMLDKCLADDPKYGPALRDKAYAHAAAGALDKAMTCAEKAIEGEPDDWYGRYVKADLYRRAGDREQAMKAIKEAKDRGGDYDSTLHTLEALCHLDGSDADKAMACYRRAVEANAEDVNARLGIARCHDAKGNGAGALLEYGKLLKDFPDNSWVHESYGRHLLTVANREREAFDELITAAEMAIESEGRAPAALLRDLGKEAIARGGRDELVRNCALLLSRDWGGWANWSHYFLSVYWQNKGRASIANAHANARDRLERKSPGSAVTLFTFDDVRGAAESGYSPVLLDELFSETAFGFTFTQEHVPQLQKWPAAAVQAVTRKYWGDQAVGSGVLGSQIQVKFASDVRIDDARNPIATIELTNATDVALTGFRVRFEYKDKNKKVLWSCEDTINLTYPVFSPRQSQSLAFRFHDWTTLEKNGAPKDAIGWYSMNVISARNAAYLSNLKAEGKVLEGGRGYEVRVANGSAFTLKTIQVRCEYVDAQSKPVVDSAGWPIGETRTFDGPVAAGQSMAPVVVKDWSDWNFIQKLGLPRNVQTVYPTVRVVGAEVVPK